MDGTCLWHASLKPNHVLDVAMQEKTRERLLEYLGVLLDNLEVLSIKFLGNEVAL